VQLAHLRQQLDAADPVHPLRSEDQSDGLAPATHLLERLQGRDRRILTDDAIIGAVAARQLVPNALQRLLVVIDGEHNGFCCSWSALHGPAGKPKSDASRPATGEDPCDHVTRAVPQGLADLAASRNV
jgi:hypothetical protein